MAWFPVQLGQEKTKTIQKVSSDLNECYSSTFLKWSGLIFPSSRVLIFSL